MRNDPGTILEITVIYRPKVTAAAPVLCKENLRMQIIVEQLPSRESAGRESISCSSQITLCNTLAVCGWTAWKAPVCDYKITPSLTHIAVGKSQVNKKEKNSEVSPTLMPSQWKQRPSGGSKVKPSQLQWTQLLLCFAREARRVGMRMVLTGVSMSTK